MWITVKSMDGKVSHQINGLSRLTKVKQLRKLLHPLFHIAAAQQRLFYRGKQLEDGHTLFDYDVQLNDTIQILAKQVELDSSSVTSKNDSSSKEVGSSVAAKNDERRDNNQLALQTTPATSSSDECESRFYKIGDKVDAKESSSGAWFEATVVAIKPKEESDSISAASSGVERAKNEMECDGLLYSVILEDDETLLELSLQSIRPRPCRLIPFSDVQIGDEVMVNYNFEEPTKKGYWYDCIVQEIKLARSGSHLIGTVNLGSTAVEVCKIVHVDEIYAVEKNGIQKEDSSTPKFLTRSKAPVCSKCDDDSSKSCQECGCSVCSGKEDPNMQILCDECNLAFHIWCLNPPLAFVPEDDWYCADCKNDEKEVVLAGEKLKASKKKSKMPSASASSSRDWGKGMACAGRTKECTLVPKNHFGPIPGVEVGSMWKFRVQVSESGIHRPPVGGIHGRDKIGAFSIVLSGGYEDDVDNGEEFLYTGSGGRDLNGNKRCAPQSGDQALSRYNKALAMNCDAPLSSEGAKAKDWKKGKPVRVVRNFKGKKHSKYCPEDGNRYDGIYKVVKYWPEKGKAGFLVWRFLLRRDDPSPAPWTPKGKKRIEELGLEMEFPEGFVKLDESEEKENEKKKKSKRKYSGDEASTSKRKIVYQLPEDIVNLIHLDDQNKKLWDEALSHVNNGKKEFLLKINELFLCICCQELVYKPITTPCFHNICQECLERAFKAKVLTCPMCRQPLERNVAQQVNESLQVVLNSILPAYGAAR